MCRRFYVSDNELRRLFDSVNGVILPVRSPTKCRFELAGQKVSSKALLRGSRSTRGEGIRRAA